MGAIVADLATVEPPTNQEMLDQLDIGVVRQFQRMFFAEGD